MGNDTTGGDGLQISAFTDTYHSTINGVAETLDTWAKYWNEMYGRMDIIYPRHPEYEPSAHEYPLPSCRFPTYDSYRIGVPWVPPAVRSPDIIHLHSLYPVGVAGGILAKLNDRPVVATYHTPINEYTDYVTTSHSISNAVTRILRAYERTMLNRVDRVISPSEHTRRYLSDDLQTTTPISVISNGIDTELFQPADGAAFRARFNLSGPVIGYTGRHGFEKHLERIIAAAEQATTDLTLVFGGDGPARESLERRAQQSSVDTRFLGFLPREQLPAFYAALDAFAFPSAIETEGIVAMESIACGTPVVAVKAGALPETIDHGTTGYLYSEGDLSAFAQYLDMAIEQSSEFRERCLEIRPSLSVTDSLSDLHELYRDLHQA